MALSTMELVTVCAWILSSLVIQALASTPIIATLSPEVAGVEKVYSKPGTMGFRILRKESNSALIGGREMLLTVNHNDPKNLQMDIEEFKTCDNANAFIQCRARTTFRKDRDCFNFIRIAEVMTDNMLLVCGTNALNPRCYTCNVTRDNTGIQEVDCPGPKEDRPCAFSSTDGKGTVPGTGIAPKHWELNATSQYADGQLFLGVSLTHGKADSSISRVNVYPSGLQGSDTSFTDRLDTTSYFSRSVNEADFVGKPLVIGDRVYYFYRELAVEHVNQGKMVFSRVARVCKGDAGIDNFWSSFQKARLSCAVAGVFPLYYNEIQDIFVEERGTDHYIHAVFSGVPNGPQSSAVCVYRLSDIDIIFDESSFRGPLSSDHIWLTRPKMEVPIPRPGLNCSNPTRDLTFIKQFPLMQTLVKSVNEYEPSQSDTDVPIFTLDNARFSAIVVDNITAEKIYYVGTETGSVLKAYHNGAEFKVYEVSVTDNEQPIVGLQLAGDFSNRHIIAVSDNSVYRVPLHNCATKCMKRCEELMYGYCHWDGGCCKENGQTECAADPTDVYVSMEPSGPIRVCENERIQLYCHAQSDPFCPAITLEWTMDGGQPVNDLGHLISIDHLSNDPSHQMSMLTVQSAITKNTTSMECTAQMKLSGEPTVVTKATTINITNCITHGALQKRYHMHQQLRNENDLSKTCSVDVFDCARCSSFP